MGVTCYLCKRVLSNQSALNRHVKRVHQLEPTPKAYDKLLTIYKSQCLEPNCHNAYKEIRQLVEHLRNDHGLKFGNEEITVFENMSEFLSWKTEYEKANKSNYIVDRTYWMGKNGIDKKIYCYSCNRSNRGYQVKENRQRRMKSQGSCKINGVCTSYIKAIEKIDGRVEIFFQKRHYGHTLDLQHLRLSKEERSEIASRLMAGIPKEKIVDSVRDQIEESVKRIDLLSTREVYNIKRSIQSSGRDDMNPIPTENLKKKLGIDAVTLDSWVEECQAVPEEENPILFYKKVGYDSDLLDTNDFCLIIMNNFQKMMLKKFGSNLICMDKTYGIDSDFEVVLISLTVVDEFEQGVPVAFMLSNRIDTAIFNILFGSIKKKVGTICAKTFMSDFDQTIYNAWSVIMEPAENKLFCPWYFQDQWQANLSLIEDEQTRGEAITILTEIQEELDQHEFESKMQYAIDSMLEDNYANSFGRYLNTNFRHNSKQWAYCYLAEAGISSTMKLESLHETIMRYNAYSDRLIKKPLGTDKTLTLNKTLSIVLKYVRDQSIARITNMSKPTSCDAEIKETIAESEDCEIADNVDDNFDDNDNNHAEDVKPTRPDDNLKDKLKQLFEKLQHCDLDDLDDSVIFQMNNHLNVLNNLVEKSQTNAEKITIVLEEDSETNPSLEVLNKATSSLETAGEAPSASNYHKVINSLSMKPTARQIQIQIVTDKRPPPLILLPASGVSLTKAPALPSSDVLTAASQRLKLPDLIKVLPATSQKVAKETPKDLPIFKRERKTLNISKNAAKRLVVSNKTPSPLALLKKAKKEPQLVVLLETLLISQVESNKPSEVYSFR